MDTLSNIIFHLDTILVDVIQEYGLLTYIILFIVVFTECGIIVFPFFPGDGLLFSVGVIAAKGLLNVWLVIFIFVMASIGGYYLNYWLGKNLGYRLFASPKFKLLNQNHFIKTHQFYQKHGAKTILFGRFIPYIRTFLPFLAGMALMDNSLFHRYNIIGGLFWSFSVTLVGYYLGHIPFIETHFMWIVTAMIVGSWIPFIYTGLKWVFKKLLPKSKTIIK